MEIQVLREIYRRELNTLRQEILEYPREEDLWRGAPGIANPGGTLALHLVGNLQHFVGRVLGDTDYRRDRDAEFERRGVPRAELLAGIDEAMRVVDRTLAGLDPGRLRETYPIPYRDTRPTVEWLLVHLISHLSYHVGQVNYHRRLLAQ